MAHLIMIAADVIAIVALTVGIYFTRHRRRDLVVAFVGVNVGVLAVAEILANASVALGVGLGLFGVLSIIRLRSSEISQREVAYYFAALALGLIAGLTDTVNPLPLALMAMIVVALYIVDHPRVMARHRHVVMTLDRALADEAEVRAHLTETLGGTVKQLTVISVDFVNDTTVIDVRYQVASVTPAARTHEQVAA